MKTKTIKTNMVTSNGNGAGLNGDLKSAFGKRVSDALHNLPLRADAKHKLGLVMQRAANTVNIGFEKAVAHMENPSAYPLPAGNDNVEKAFYDLLMALPALKRKKFTDKINETLKASSQERNKLYGDLAGLNFSSAVSIAEQVKSMNTPEEMMINKSEGDELLEMIKKNFEKPVINGYSTGNKPVPQQAVSAGSLGFFVDNMTCNNPDDVFKDEVSLAGFIIDSLGNKTELEPRFIGKFRKNETVNLGANSKLFTVAIDPFLAEQTFAASLFIIEGDLVSNLEALNKLIIVLGLIALTLGIIAMGIVIAGVLGAAVTITQFIITFFGGTAIGLLDLNIIPLLGDDISNVSTDTLFLDGRIDLGTEFSRTIVIGEGFASINTFDGKYTANARWVGEA